MDEDRNGEAWVAVLIQALKDGTVLDRAPGEVVDVSQGVDWPEMRRLPGQALRAALLNSDIKPDPRGLKIRAAYITGPTDLANLRVPYALHFDSCAFEQHADWQGLAVPNLSLIGCTTAALILNEAHIGGTLSLEGATLVNPGGIALAMDGADIKGDVILKRSTH